MRRYKLEATLLIKNAKQVVTSRGASEEPKIKEALGEIEIIENGAVAVQETQIIAVGSTEAVMERVKIGPETEVIDASDRIVLPGLVDPHTHVIHAGSREHELELKLKGVAYLDILAQGGGILSTVRATRSSSKEELVRQGLKYCDQMLSQGTTTAEAKSGYGLTTEAEIKTLEAIQEVNAKHFIDLVPTFLGAHAIPLEYKGEPERYVDLVIEEMIPAVAEKGLAEYCDVFCEQGVFSVAQSRRILKAAREHGFKLKLHADEIVPLGGAELAAELGATSADHLLVVSETGIGRMAEEKVIAVLLPGTTFYLQEDHFAPARKLIDSGVPVA
ncbi:MAG: imidazolonepropionase, partial [Firmicutes bacterium]|nr:imidazolonepropionase [Bacillota bacterium]